MNAKTVTSAVVIGLWWLCAPAHAQDTPALGIQPPPIKKDAPEAVPLPVATEPSTSGLSDWILYKRPDQTNCCTPGANIPLYSEVYMRVGPSIPVGGNYVGRQLNVGWSIEGGIRGLLFRGGPTSAWVVDAHVINTNESGIGNADPVVLNIFVKNAAGTSTLQNVTVTPKNYNRTLAGLGVGKEWYLWGSIIDPGNKWRIGVDGGGRYGSGSMTYNEIRHRTDVLGGLYGAAHTDFEVPYGRCFLYWGLRAEWAYTWGDILQKQSDVQDINFLVTFGVRF